MYCSAYSTSVLSIRIYRLGNVACVGDEASLDKCNHDGWGVDRCNGFSTAESADSSSGPASVICSDTPYNNFPISLKGSDTATEGRVEIHYQVLYEFYRGLSLLYNSVVGSVGYNL